VIIIQVYWIKALIINLLVLFSARLFAPLFALKEVISLLKIDQFEFLLLQFRLSQSEYP
jgi:hypothetical protein